jgi:hypothetical protein
MRKIATVLSACAILTAAACGDDKINKGFRPTPPSDDYGPASPLTAGTTLYYLMSATYRPISGTDARTGTTYPEQQNLGNLCIKIDEVRDTSTEQYHEAAETVIIGRAKVTGGQDFGEIRVTDLVNPPPADAGVVDTALSPLWMKTLTFPQSRGHGYTAPKQVTFLTRSAPMPTQNIAALPLFEARTYEDGWRGFTDTLSKLYVDYFTGVLALDLTPTSTKFKQRYQAPPASCETVADVGTCGGTTGCFWDPDGAKCWGMHRLNLAWRETLTTGPSELQGDVVHTIQVEYTTQGVLRLWREYIVPDVNPSMALRTDQLQCIDGEPCAAGLLDRDEWASSSCTF